ncbi:hypothetical protein MMC18_003506 [Xylographa bjoerkii]|nr:hypothetical protein [Xylographa bjoerkii]
MILVALRGSIRAFSRPYAVHKPGYPYRRMISSSKAGRYEEMLLSPKDAADRISMNESSHPTSRIVPLCAAWFLPNDPQGRTGRNAFAQKRIPGARFLDIDAVKDEESPYPHMLPTAERFAQAMSELGLKRDDDLIVYDTHELGIFSAPRVAWMLQVFGHPNFHILNNFRLWVEQGYPTDTAEPSSGTQESTDYPVPSFNMDRVIAFRGVRDIVKEHGQEGSQGVQIIDARSAGRFSGSEPEPRPGLSSGHMPGSINLPLPEILDPTSKAFLSAEELKRVFEGRGLNPKKPIVTTCGTGVMAAALDTALQAGQFGPGVDKRVYDGSWTEWAQRGSESDGLIEKA